MFAIAITLLVLEIRPPSGWDGHISNFVSAVAAKMIFYLISFVVVGRFWTAHRFMFRYVRRFNEGASLLNIGFLCMVCLTPFVNALILDNLAKFAAYQIYLGLMVVISLSMGVLWIYMSMLAGLTDPALRTAFKWVVLLRLAISPPLIAGISMWLGITYGIWPSVGFIIPAFLLVENLRISPFATPADKGDKPETR